MTRSEGATPARHFAAQLRHYREARKLTQPALAELCSQAGLNWNRSIVANIEAGRREDITLTEVAVVAYVLQVPAMLLILPIGTAPEVEILPGRVMDTWTAARWFMGDDGSEGYDPDGKLTGDPDRWKAATAPLHLSHEHDHLVGEYVWTLLDLQLFANDPKLRQQRTATADDLLRDLRSVRAEMRRHGMTPPELDDDLRHVDERRHVYLTPEQAATIAAEHPGAIRPVDYSPAASRRAARGIGTADDHVS